MTQKLIELSSHYPGLLSCLAKTKQGDSYSIVEKEKDHYYLDFSDADNIINTEEAETSADILLANINAILRLPPFQVTNAIQKTGKVVIIDSSGQEIVRKPADNSGPLQSSPDFTLMDFSNFTAMQNKSNKSFRLKQAMQYYSGGTNWFNFYDVYETIETEYREITRDKKLPMLWTTDLQDRDRRDDFTESANNANLSGYGARHSYADSHRVVRMGDNRFLIKGGPNRNKEITRMNLQDGKTFIDNLLIQRLKCTDIGF
jgi:hypothetical protein